jgi:carboxyl-terminal processing protease
MNNKITIVLYFLFLGTINNVNAQVTTPDSFNGIWKMRGYGKIIEINDSIVNNYDVTVISRTLNSQIKKESIEELGKMELLNKNVLTLKEGKMNYFLDRIDEFPNIKVNSEKLKDSNYIFDVFWNTMNENYPFFKERNVDWSNIQTKYGEKKIKNERQLRRILKKIINQLNDDHTTIVAKRSSDPLPYHGSNKFTSNLEDKILNHYVKTPKRHGRSINGNGLLNYGITENNLGYIQINNMMFFSDKYNISSTTSGFNYLFAYLEAAANNKNHVEEEKKEVNILMQNIIQELQNTNAIIIDLRFNMGGFDFVSLEILKYFINTETTLFSKKAKILEGFTEPQNFSIDPADKTYNKPVFLLTSHQTGSAAEIFTLGSMKMKNIIRVGSNTKGIFSDVLKKKLPNGWTLNISNEVYQSDEGICYENVGIQSNKQIKYSKNAIFFIAKLKTRLRSGDKAIEMVYKLIEK